jgi:hypothetical protein
MLYNRYPSSVKAAEEIPWEYHLMMKANTSKDERYPTLSLQNGE